MHPKVAAVNIARIPFGMKTAARPASHIYFLFEPARRAERLTVSVARLHKVGWLLRCQVQINRTAHVRVQPVQVARPAAAHTCAQTDLANGETLRKLQKEG